jgi:hypothetical protein
VPIDRVPLHGVVDNADADGGDRDRGGDGVKEEGGGERERAEGGGGRLHGALGFQIGCELQEFVRERQREAEGAEASGQ